MTEYMTSNINSVLKNYQNSAPKSLQGPAVIKKEILSSPEPHELLHHHEINSAGVGVAAAALPGETTGAARQLFVAPLPLPPELSQPILSQPDLGCGELYETRLEGKIIGCFSLGGEMRLCLPQFLNNVLNDFTLDQINKIFDELGIYCSQCTPEQLVEFKAAKILPSDVKASGLITRTDAERLCAALLPRSDRNSYMHVDDLAKGAISFQVYHKCFGKCEGICTPDMYSYQKPTCIKCLECKGWFSPQKFVGHVHRKFENRTCHWGFDSRNWHDYLHVALNVENREKYQRILDQLKEVELKEMHKAQCELDHKKRKADMLMEDALLAAAPLGLVAPQAAHQPLATSLKYQHHHQLIELPSKKHKSAAAAAAAAAAPPLETYTLGYQLMYAHCVQQQQRELEREQQQQQQQQQQQLVSSAFQPWTAAAAAAAAKRPSPAYLHALNALYACQEPPQLQNPERVVRSSDRERFERTYQPNVALAPRKSILSKERERERELQLHIKQERVSTPATLSSEPLNGSSSSSSNSNSSNSSSPMPKQKSRSPAEDCCAGSNEITSSTSPVPAATAAATLTAAAATAGTTAIVATAGGAHIIATVNQHAKLLPTSSNHHSLETSRIRINKNLLPPAAAAAATITLAPPSGQALLHYKTPCYSPTQSSSAGLNLSTHSSNVVSSPQLKTQQQSAQQQQQQPLPLTNGHKPHLGSEFELSTDTDDDSLNGEPDSSAMLPPWELAVEALRDTRPKERERVLQLLQRLLQENQQCRYNNAQLSEHLHKQEAHIAELSEQLQCYRRQLETLEKLRVGVLPLKQQQQQEQAQDQANNNNHNNHLLEQEPLQPASKRLKLLQEEEEEDSNQSHSSNSCEQQQPQQPQQQQQQLRSDEEEDELEELDEDEEELLALPTAAEAPHSSACATPPTATTPISPDSAATAGQLFDSSNSSDECSMKKAQMSACQALDKISSNGNNNNSNNNNSSSSNSQQQSDAEEEEFEEQQQQQQQQDSELEEEESDDDEMPLQQRQQHQQQQQQQQQRRQQAEVAAPTPVLMATKASKKQTPPTPTASPITTATAAAAITTAAATTTTTTAATISTTNCDLQIKKELA